MKAEMEMIMRINFHCGDCIKVSEDRDGLGLLAIRYRTDDGNISSEIAFDAEHTDLLISALNSVRNDLMKRRAK